jgi:protein-S-isoprenylcysteine O-methyltransferase Ste14
VYLCISLFLYVGVLVFIRKEEQQLGRVFGNEYEAYKRKVSRITPFLKPWAKQT